ncbi:MAG TPA: hypothetical protein VJB87_02085 [Candidatus Nanoarchaeia archaeon]|nr:hypothetical protein [Candidatus Nanoarchaeia archaeon]
MSWREKVPEKIKQHLETQIAQSAEHKEAYLHADDPALAQLWVAVANLSRQVYELNVRIGMFDEALREGIMQRDALLQKLVAERHIPKTNKPKAVKKAKKKVVKIKAKMKRKAVGERVKRSVRATAARTAKKVAEKIVKETAKRSLRAKVKRKQVKKKSSKGKREFILLKEA